MMLVAVGLAFGGERMAIDMIQKGAKPHDLVVEALDSSAVGRSKVVQTVACSSGVIGGAIDTVLRQVVSSVIFGDQYDSVPASGDTVKALLYSVPTSGVTSVTIKCIDIWAETPPNVAGSKIALMFIKQLDATDSSLHSIVNRAIIDTHTTATLGALWKPKNLAIDSTANAVLYAGDAVFGWFYVDSANVYTKNLGATLSLSINK